MKTLIIKEFGNFAASNAKYLDLSNEDHKNCIGCWTCWLKTPGICIYKDLEYFYRSYVNADRVIIFAKLEHGFVSAKLKTLFDRMIPLVLPYVLTRAGGSWHMPRYPKYPEIELYYDSEFSKEEDFKLFHDYIQKVFEQFDSKKISVQPISALGEGES